MSKLGRLGLLVFFAFKIYSRLSAIYWILSRSYKLTTTYFSATACLCSSAGVFASHLRARSTDDCISLSMVIRLAFSYPRLVGTLKTRADYFVCATYMRCGEYLFLSVSSDLECGMVGLVTLSR